MLHGIGLVAEYQQTVEAITLRFQLTEKPLQRIDANPPIVRLQIVPESLVTNFVGPGFYLKGTGLRILGCKFLVAAYPISDRCLWRKALGSSDLPQTFTVRDALQHCCPKFRRKSCLCHSCSAPVYA